MSRFWNHIVAGGALIACALTGIGVQAALAQTSGQMEYERQQREYWRQQEQQRQEQQRMQQLQMDNARRQQEESSRFMQQTAPGTAAPSYAAPASPPSATTGGGGRSAAQGAAERRYALPGHGYFVVIAPRDWKEQVRQPPNREPPTIVFGPAAGNVFQVLLTPSWPAKDRGPHSRDELRAAVERGAQAAKSWAVESKLPIQELQGRSPGFYFSATERAPKPGTHKYVTTGIVRVGELSVPFTISTGEGHAPVVQQTLDLLKASRQEAAFATVSPAASPGRAVDPPAIQSAGAIRMNSYYVCDGERVAVVRCRSEADDAFCSVQYPDRKSAATGGLTPELAERRGELVKKLQKCQG